MNAPEQGQTDKDGIPKEYSADYVWTLNPVVDAPGVTPGREEIRDFFGTVGGLGARARRRYEQIVPARVRSRTSLVVMSLTVSLAALAARAWAGRPPGELPVELQGAWTTTHADYADRAFWIGKHQVAFRVGPNPEDVNVYPVTHLDVTRARGDTTWYAIQYAVDGGNSNWPFEHVSLPHPAITFAHQPQVIWTVKFDPRSPAR